MEGKLVNHPLAFTSQPSLVSATSRLVLNAKDGAVLNIELFDFAPDATTTTSRPLLLFIPGICESAETKSVQNIVKVTKRRYPHFRVAVLELEGHGLSSGQRCVCPDFDKILMHVEEFVHFTVSHLTTSTATPMPFFLIGASFGGALALYGAEKLSKHYTEKNNKSKFLGVIPIVPAVGVDPRAIPPSAVVSCLKILSYVAPSLKIPFTPSEDPTHYNCPTNTTRNFAGHWPLATSKMLLDVTSHQVKNDLESGTLCLKNVENMLFIAGMLDHVIPVDIVDDVYHSLEPRTKKMIVVRKCGHDLLYDKACGESVCDELCNWISDCVVSMEND